MTVVTSGRRPRREPSTPSCPDNKRIDSSYGVETGGVLQQAGPKADSNLPPRPPPSWRSRWRAAPRRSPLDRGRRQRHPGRARASRGLLVWCVGPGSGAYMRACDDPSANKQMVVDTLTTAREDRLPHEPQGHRPQRRRRGQRLAARLEHGPHGQLGQVENRLEENEDEQDGQTDERGRGPAAARKTPEAEDDEFGIRPGRSFSSCPCSTTTPTSTATC